jgi:RNA polymerase sigma factor (sigma-70 family)
MSFTSHANGKKVASPAVNVPSDNSGADRHQPEVTPKPAPASSLSSAYRSDPALVQGCLDGDETAWKQLVDRYGRLVYSIPRRYGLSVADAEDIFQNVFTIVFRQLGSLRDQTRLSAWVITITHRQTQRLLRGLPDHESIDDEANSADAQALEGIQRWERRQMLHEAMSQLDPRCRQLLTDLLRESVPNYEELAGRLGMAVGSIGPTRARCFKKLEAILAALGFEI